MTGPGVNWLGRAARGLLLAVIGGVTLGAGLAQAQVAPLPVSETVAEIRTQDPFVFVPELTSEFLTLYAARQQALRSFDGFSVEPEPELTEDLLLSYIARASLGARNPALSAIDTATAPPSPALTSAILADYVAADFKPTEARLGHAEKERNCLATAIYHEARGESLSGRRAVANVIVNRARSTRYPGTLCDVVYQNVHLGRYRCQFTFACDGRPDTIRERGAWAAAEQLAAEVYAQYARGNSIDAVPSSVLYYHTTAVAPSWSRTFRRVAQVGSHIFYSPN